MNGTELLDKPYQLTLWYESMAVNSDKKLK